MTIIMIIKFANLLNNGFLNMIKDFSSWDNVLDTRIYLRNTYFAWANTQIYVVRSAAYKDDYPYCS